MVAAAAVAGHADAAAALHRAGVDLVPALEECIASGRADAVGVVLALGASGVARAAAVAPLHATCRCGGVVAGWGLPTPHSRFQHPHAHPPPHTYPLHPTPLTPTSNTHMRTLTHTRTHSRTRAAVSHGRAVATGSAPQ
jgi:hypothetical protein